MTKYLPKIFARQDFYRQFGPRCAGCQLVFSETEKVRKIDQSFFHGHCFKCKDCSKDLTEAEKVGCDQNGNLLCEADFLKYHCDEPDNRSNTERLLDECDPDILKKDENSQPNRDMVEGNNSEEEHDLNKEVMDDPKNKRKRGPKTTIKPHQLEILKNCFDQNPKPTPKVFEELSKDTGLSKRVIQVWFQNKRSKTKRINQLHFMNHSYRMAAFLPPNHRRALHQMPFPPNSMAGPGQFEFRPPFPPQDCAGPFPPPGPEFGGYQPPHNYPIEQGVPCDFGPLTQQPGPFPSPPLHQGDFPPSSGDFPSSECSDFPSPPLSDCSIPDYQIPAPHNNDGSMVC